MAVQCTLCHKIHENPNIRNFLFLKNVIQGFNDKYSYINRLEMALQCTLSHKIHEKPNATTVQVSRT